MKYIIYAIQVIINLIGVVLTFPLAFIKILPVATNVPPVYEPCVITGSCNCPDDVTETV